MSVRVKKQNVKGEVQQMFQGNHMIMIVLSGSQKYSFQWLKKKDFSV